MVTDTLASDTGAPHLPGAPKTFACPSCGGTIILRAVGISITAVCPSCHTPIDVANETLRIIGKAAKHQGYPAIPLGARGQLMGTRWEAVGFQVLGTTVDDRLYEWREYLLFNPWQGYRFLVESDGHWNFVRMLHCDLGEPEKRVRFQNDDYALFDQGTASVHYVLGEFYWRVRVGDSFKTADYVCVPYMLSREESGGDIIWSQGISVESEKIAAAFGITIPMPTRVGAGMSQPSPYTARYIGAKQAALCAAILLLALQLVFAASAPNQLLVDQAVRLDPAYRGRVALDLPVAVTGRSHNIEIETFANLTNSWAEATVDWVDIKTQKSDEFVLPMEYYSGYDSDGSWSEGSPKATALLHSVPAGDYRLLVEGDAESLSRNQPASLRLQVRRGVSNSSNFWMALLLIVLYPLYLWWQNNLFETTRWSKSDFPMPSQPARSRRPVKVDEEVA